MLGLDYFFGDPISNHSGDDKFDMQAWLKKYRGEAAEATPGWIKAVREIYGEHYLVIVSMFSHYSP